jgi:hypothetical protein
MDTSKAQNNGNSPNSTKSSSELNRKLETLKVLAPLCAACRDAPQGEGLDLIAQCLADIPLDALKIAIVRCLTESEDRWFPAVGKLRRLAVESQAGIIPGWEWAWNEILKALRVWNQFDREACLKAREMLGEELMQLVASMGGFYSLTNADSFEVLQSNFRNVWTQKKQQAETLRKTPEGLRPRIGIDSANEVNRIENN